MKRKFHILTGLGLLTLGLLSTDIQAKRPIDTVLSQADPHKGESITLKGKEIHTKGKMIAKGKMAPDFTATNSDMQDIHLSQYRGKRVILNIFPSLDTPTCAASVRFFNETASQLENTVVLCLSKDLPFAQRRFCTTEGIQNVIPLSLFRSGDFEAYGLEMADGPSKGLMARAVIVLDEQGKVIETQLVKEVSQEPDYEPILQALK